VNEVEVCSRRGKNSKGSKISGICFKPNSEEVCRSIVLIYLYSNIVVFGVFKR
jgi:hypothetical protein